MIILSLNALAQDLADTLKLPYIETSAKEAINVEAAFVTLAALVKEKCVTFLTSHCHQCNDLVR